MAVEIHPTAIIYPGVAIEDDVRIGAYAVIGGPPEHRAHDGKPAQGVLISRGARIFEFVSIHAGTQRPTYIGEGTMIFNHSHIAHDVEINDYVTVAGHSSIGGHVTVMDRAFIGGRATIHQHCVVGAYAMIGMCSALKSHVPVGELWMGSPCRPAGINHVALSRCGVNLSTAMEMYGPGFLYLRGESKL